MGKPKEALKHYNSQTILPPAFRIEAQNYDSLENNLKEARKLVGEIRKDDKVVGMTSKVLYVEEALKRVSTSIAGNASAGKSGVRNHVVCAHNAVQSIKSFLTYSDPSPEVIEEFKNAVRTQVVAALELMYDKRVTKIKNIATSTDALDHSISLSEIDTNETVDTVGFQYTEPQADTSVPQETNPEDVPKTLIELDVEGLAKFGIKGQQMPGPRNPEIVKVLTLPVLMTFDGMVSVDQLNNLGFDVFDAGGYIVLKKAYVLAIKKSSAESSGLPLIEIANKYLTELADRENRTWSLMSPRQGSYQQSGYAYYVMMPDSALNMFLKGQQKQRLQVTSWSFPF